MIRCLLIHVSRNQRGQAIRQEQWVEGDRLDIGRASECNVHLPDHRVSLHHATIRYSDEGRLYLEGENTPISVDGSFEQSVELCPGMRFLIGPYQLEAEAISDSGELTLGYELIHPLPQPGENSGNPAPMTLGETGLSKRKIALWLAGFIAIVFFVLPVTYTLNPWVRLSMKDLPVTPDEPWNAGTMSPGHRALTAKCSTCHREPFKAVENATCESCHKNTPRHIADAALHGKIFGKVRCSKCHLDHRGKKGLVRHDNRQCVVCHGEIKTRHPASRLTNIHDFNTDHPAFRLSVRTEPGEDGVQRIRQSASAGMTESSGLKFSHQVHFDKALIEHPGGKARDIQCYDCHKPDEAEQGYQPMTMEMTCQQSKCHALNFEPPIEGRLVPHASVQTVMTTLRELFARKALDRAISQDAASGNVRTLRDRAEAEAARNAEYLFTKAEEGTCLECHEISRDQRNSKTPWQVAPVDITDYWMPKARFPHGKHKTSKCTDCHDIMQSEKSSDMAIPTIAKCRECHAGSRQTKTQVSSTCDTCHNFHGAARRHAPKTTDDTPE